MAIKRMTIDGYASLELNRVSFPIKGEVFADLPLAEAFNESAPAENGMILAVDYATGEVKLPTGSDDILALHFTTEKEYDPNNPGLNRFHLTARRDGFSSRNQVFYPRLGKLAVGDRFTSNCIAYDDGEFGDDDALLTAFDALGTTPLYGQPCSNGAIQITATPPTTDVALRVSEITTIPNGDLGLKFVVIVAQ